jgi:hypothetical protein
MDQAVRFPGDPHSFGAALTFARNRNWLTEPEQRLVSALYGVLSDCAAHPGQSIMDPAFARQAVLHSLWLVLRRFQVRVARPFVGYGGSAGRLRLAEQFLKGVRTGVLIGPAFEVDFDQDLMQLTRQRLQYSDIKPLMSVVRNDRVSADLRCNCASLVLSPRCYRKPADANWPRIISELDRYCDENLRALPWQVSRAIGLALANRANHSDRLLDYLDWIGQDPDLIETNLAESDAYHAGIQNAFDYYRSRIENVAIPLSGCVWEAYYISRRLPPKSGALKSVLDRRIKELETGRLHTFFQAVSDALAVSSRGSR